MARRGFRAETVFLRLHYCAPEQGVSGAVSVVYTGSGLTGVDGKGRTTVPAELRDFVQRSSSGNRVCIARHPEYDCLIGFGTTERDQRGDDVRLQWEAAVNRGEDFDREAAGAASSCFEFPFEDSGRFVLSPMLRHFGKIQDSAYFFGVSGHFMLWNPDIFASSGPDKFRQQKEELEFLRTIGKRGQ